MRAVTYDSFGALPVIGEVPDAVCDARGAIVRVLATGVCRSDWHAWQGHDDDVVLPHTPGHEFAGVVAAVGEEVTRFAVGDRVTAPFILACGACDQCAAGATQVCTAQLQPGFTLPGSFAERVGVVEADLNLVALPDGLDFVDAAGLGCRFGTAYHALRVQGRVRPGEHVVVFGCGGVGLSCVMVALAAGAEVIAVDVSRRSLDAARALGATPVAAGADVAHRVRDMTGGGAHVTVDAFGSSQTLVDAVLSLRPRGRHVQVGLLLDSDADPSVPMGRVIADELVILGSHGIAVAEYEDMLRDIAEGRLVPGDAVGRVIAFDDLPDALAAMGRGQTAGMTVARLEPDVFQAGEVDVASPATAS
jgi:alcohol dehydrogenase